MFFFLWGGYVNFSKIKTPTFKEILNLRSPGNSLISPDGRFVLFTVRQPDWEANEYRTQIWLVETSTGEIRQMTFSKKSSHNSQWSPDSKFISFLSARDEKSQIYVMSVSGGEARQLTKSKTGVRSYKWSPDGTKIAFTASDEKSKKDKAIERKYGKFEIVDQNFNVSRLWLFDIDTEKADKLIDRDDLHLGGFDWSPENSAIAFTAMPDPRAESYSKSDIYVLNVAEKSIQKLVDLPGSDSSPLWSPCGKFIAFRSNFGRGHFFVNSQICTIPAKGGNVTSLTKDFDENVYPSVWNQDGIYFTAFKDMAMHIFKVHPKTNEMNQITKGDGLIIRSNSLTKDGSKLAFSCLDATHYPEIYYSEIKDFKPIKLTDFSSQIKNWNLSTKEFIEWKSKDGTEITGVLIKPADFDYKKKYPLLVVIHGGPASISYPQHVDRYNRYYPIEQWAAKGAVILEPNYRGSTGFGEAFRKLNYRNLGVGDYWDVISGVDHLISKGFVDKDKLGAMGWSQGGYISAFITTYSDRFKAVSVGAGISDWITYYVNTDIHPFTRIYLGTTPWDDEEIYRKTSPMTYIQNAKTPTLIQHGEFDKRVPIPNAFKLYQGLQDKGVPVKFIIYKGFGHGISKPKENLACLKHNFDWFNKFIWGEEPEEEKFGDEKEKESK
jgi:dipeptidyl aminopeptidase/acylaminoacyl peptidase